MCCEICLLCREREREMKNLNNCIHPYTKQHSTLSPKPFNLLTSLIYLEHVSAKGKIKSESHEICQSSIKDRKITGKTTETFHRKIREYLWSDSAAINRASFSRVQNHSVIFNYSRMRWTSRLLPVTTATRAKLHWMALKHQCSKGSPRGKRRAHTAPLITRTPQITLLTARGRCKSHLRQVKGRTAKIHVTIIRTNIMITPLNYEWRSGSAAVALWRMGSCESKPGELQLL